MKHVSPPTEDHMLGNTYTEYSNSQDPLIVKHIRVRLTAAPNTNSNRGGRIHLHVYEFQPLNLISMDYWEDRIAPQWRSREAHSQYACGLP